MMNTMMKKTAIATLAAMMAFTTAVPAMAADTQTIDIDLEKVMTDEAYEKAGEMMEKMAEKLNSMNEEEKAEYLNGLKNIVLGMNEVNQNAAVRCIPEIASCINDMETLEEMCENLDMFQEEMKMRKEAKEEDVNAEQKTLLNDENWESFDNMMLRFAELDEEDQDDFLERMQNVHDLRISDENKEMIDECILEIAPETEKILNLESMELTSYDAICTADDVNIRPDASTDNPAIGSLKRNDKVMVSGIVLQNSVPTGWVQVAFQGMVGYVNGSFLQKITDDTVVRSFNVFDDITGEEITLNVTAKDIVKDKNGDVYTVSSNGIWVNTKTNKKFFEDKKATEFAKKEEEKRADEQKAREAQEKAERELQKQ